MSDGETRNSNLRQVIVIGIGLLAIAALLAILDLRQNYDADEQATAALFETVRVARVESTSSAVPSDTPGVEATLAPTEAAQATAFEAIISAFSAKQSGNMIDFLDQVHDFGKQLELLVENPDLLFDQGWRDDAEYALLSLQVAALEIKILEELPEGMEEYRDLTNKSAEEMDLFVEAFLGGINAYDPEAMSSATEHLNQAIFYFEASADELRKYIDTFDE